MSDREGTELPGIISAEEPIEIVIIGGGIVGLVLAAGLVHQKVRVKLFEQARNFREIGAGIGFTAKTVQCMEKINPGVVTSLREGGSVNLSMDEHDPNSYFRWLDGYTQHREDDSDYQKMLLLLDAGPGGWETVRRDMFLDALVKIIPPGVIQLQKRVEYVEEKGRDEQIVINFADGTAVKADAVFACDGINSRTRKNLLGRDNPASFPQYTHKVAYRALIPMEKATDALGEYKARRLHMHVGPNAHLIHYPVNEKMIGATIFVTDPEDWPLDKPTTTRCTRKEVVAAFDGWCSPVHKLIDLLPEDLEQWALFDLFEYPLAAYNYGRVCLIGDAAHASSPHHGAGASMGIEDVLCLCTLLREVSAVVREHATPKEEALRAALETYNAVRRTRTQWLVNSSRRVCDLFHQPEWADPAKRTKAESCFEEIKDRSYKIWHHDPASIVEETIRDYRQRCEASFKEAEI